MCVNNMITSFLVFLLRESDNVCSSKVGHTAKVNAVFSLFARIYSVFTCAFL